MSQYPSAGPQLRPGLGYPQPLPSTNNMATASIVLGTLGFLALPFTIFIFGVFGLVGSALPVVLGHLALREIKRTGQRGSALAVIGLVLGYGQAAAILLNVALAAFSAMFG